MRDPIERQDAIDAIERNACNTQRAIDAVMGLPSAQPEVDCRKCVFSGFPGFKQFQTKTEEQTAESVQNVQKDDLISRKAAIDSVCEYCEYFKNEDVIQTIKDLPSAQPDSLGRSSARWMSVGHKRARICSHCFRDEPYKFADHDADIYDFCPHCGADMRGGKGGKK